MEKTAKIALRYPAQLSDRTLSSITMRRPTVGDMLDYPIKNGGLDEEAALVAALTGLRPEDLRELDMEDYERLQDQLLTFSMLRSRDNSRYSMSRFGARKDPDGTLEKGLRMLVVSLSRLTRWPLRDVLALTPDEAEAWLDTACELEKRLSA